MTNDPTARPRCPWKPHGPVQYVNPDEWGDRERAAYIADDIGQNGIGGVDDDQWVADFLLRLLWVEIEKGIEAVTIEAECRQRADLLTRAADEVSAMRVRLQLAEAGHEGQRRNTVAFMRERDEARVEIERLRARIAELEAANAPKPKPIENDLMSKEPMLVRWKGQRFVAIQCDFTSRPVPAWTYRLQCVDDGKVHHLPPSPTMMPEGVEVIGPLHARGFGS